VNVKNNESFRSLERGAKIIATIPHSFKVILQMPRGNLEGIYPRILLLSHLYACLNALNYKESIFLIRKHKVDMKYILLFNVSLVYWWTILPLYF
jgi:elongator complex protein 1